MTRKRRSLKIVASEGPAFPLSEQECAQMRAELERERQRLMVWELALREVARVSQRALEYDPLTADDKHLR